ncbi:retrovirus-related Pol polyprotein from transposon 297 [Trichonephila clavipes]|nr:retrovirus-related Pol polyprotein from transposon 297 [Trichonephila clavipes]
MLKPYYKRPEFINMINCRAREDSNELEENLPYIDSNPNIFDFDEITDHSQLENRLNIHQREKLKEILHSNEPGKTHLVEHDIELINDVPIKTKPYRMSARQTDLLQEEIRKMLKYQVIEMGESDYVSPMILVVEEILGLASIIGNRMKYLTVCFVPNTSQYSPLRPAPSHHHPSFSPQESTMYKRNQRVSQQRPAVLRPDAPTFYPSQRTQENNMVFQPHRT